MADILRRTVLSRAAGLGIGMVVASGGGSAFAVGAQAEPTAGEPGGSAPVPEALRKEQARVKTGKPSANGWEMENVVDDHGSVWTQPIAGSGVTVALRTGDVATVLTHVIRRFNYEIAMLGPDEVIGYREPGSFPTRHESNHASGTAVDIRPDWYPLGATDGYFAHQLEVLRDILADCEGVVRWGGDLKPVDQGHFQIDVPPGDQRLKAVADKIRRWNDEPGAGAGILVDPRHAQRQQKARSLELVQRP
ncbi:M15 family metallopeptidase [Kitasatospora sp. NPDC093102]|uniref:M15 family metallopeptidase n=1 Tax=Kitasatospora sp. NPDC093102 TaxID=3155069 RepID=UPI003436A816